MLRTKYQILCSSIKSNFRKACTHFIVAFCFGPMFARVHKDTVLKPVLCICPVLFFILNNNTKKFRACNGERLRRHIVTKKGNSLIN